MTFISFKNMADNIGNRYALCLLVSKRAQEISEGSRPLVDCPSKQISTIALREVMVGKVGITEKSDEKE